MQKNEINLNDVKRTTVKVSKLKIREPFCCLYGNNPHKGFWERVKSFFSHKKEKTHNDRRINTIYKSIKKNGYDKKFPIKVIKENKKFTILDGQYRYLGAKIAHVKKVPIEIVNTENFSGTQKELDKELVKNLCSLQWKRK